MYRRLFAIPLAGLLAAGLTVATAQGATAQPAAPHEAAPAAPVAATPPMGWNDWYAFQCNLNEPLIEQTADTMVSSRYAGRRLPVREPRRLLALAQP